MKRFEQGDMILIPRGSGARSGQTACIEFVDADGAGLDFMCDINGKKSGPGNEYWLWSELQVAPELQPKQKEQAQKEDVDDELLRVLEQRVLTFSQLSNQPSLLICCVSAYPLRPTGDTIRARLQSLRIKGKITFVTGRWMRVTS